MILEPHEGVGAGGPTLPVNLAITAIGEVPILPVIRATARPPLLTAQQPTFFDDGTGKVAPVPIPENEDVAVQLQSRSCRRTLRRARIARPSATEGQSNQLGDPWPTQSRRSTS